MVVWRGAEAMELEEESENEIQVEKEDTKGYGHTKKRKKKNSSSVASDSSQQLRKEGSYLVGMIAVTRTDGIFKNPHEVGKFVEGKVGAVKSVRITRSGMVIIDCVSKCQGLKALDINTYKDHSCVECFRLGPEAMKKGVISGVPLSVDAESFEDVQGVFEARRMKRFRDGKKEDSKSICLTFKGEVLERVCLDYVCYKVRPYERAPLRCFCCQEYGHVAAVCRGVRRCGRCGKDNCNMEDCTEQTKCLHCEGKHHAGSAQCPKRIKVVKVNKIRAEEGRSYAEAVKRMERNDEMVAVQNEPEQKRNGAEQNICMDKKGFLAFIAMVINCAVEIQGKSERIKMVLDAARRFLNVVDISGEELDVTLREGFALTQTVGSGV